ncbi:hypothetical protein [Frankia sp. AiPs1]|uniref:hypothetical protein n=1 Tax=Frankia sp. AiPs1 TaxID=573493 RepID=UPI0035ABE6D4
MDVTDTGSIDAVVRDVVSRHGRIDVLVNNRVRPRAPRYPSMPTPSARLAG